MFVLHYGSCNALCQRCHAHGHLSVSALCCDFVGTALFLSHCLCARVLSDLLHRCSNSALINKHFASTVHAFPFSQYATYRIHRCPFKALADEKYYLKAWISRKRSEFSCRRASGAFVSELLSFSYAHIAANVQLALDSVRVGAEVFSAIRLQLKRT